MIVQEPYKEGLIRTYSDAGFKILQETGAKYDEAIDIANTTHTYTETDEPVDSEELTDTEALNIIMGRDQDGSTDGDDVQAGD